MYIKVQYTTGLVKPQLLVAHAMDNNIVALL